MQKKIQIKTDKLFTNITNEVNEFAVKCGKSGLMNIFSKHTTGCIWLTEDEILHQVEPILENAIDTLNKVVDLSNPMNPLAKMNKPAVEPAPK